MENKREIAKLILAGLLMTASLPADVHAENFSGNEAYLAVAGCGSGCAGKPGSSIKSDGQVADAGQMSTYPKARTGQKSPTTSYDESRDMHRGGGSKPITSEDDSNDDDDD